MSEQRLRFYSARDVREALPMKEAVEAMKDAFAQLSEGAAVTPARTHIEASGPQGDALFMPSYMPRDRRMGMKIVTIFDENRSKGLPRIQAIMIVIDGESGRPVAVMDGTSLTAIRTGAASGAATDLLARDDAKVAAIFGAGAQARTQLEGVCAVRDIQEARVYARTQESAEAFAAEMAKRLNIPVAVSQSPSAALAGADICCTATTSATPVFADSDLSPGVHINAIGSYKPDVREAPGETVRRARVVVDHRPAALAEAGDLLIPMAQGVFRREDIHAELGEIACGRKTGRVSEEEVTLFKSVGVAVQDLAAAAKVIDRAERLGLGVEVSL